MKPACKNDEINLEEKKCPPRKENVTVATLTNSSLCRQLMGSNLPTTIRSKI